MCFPKKQRPEPRICWLLAGIIAVGNAGCACGRFGTLAAKRTLTATAEIVEVYSFGALLRPFASDAGLGLGWRHATYIYPRESGDETGARWSFGWAPMRPDVPFFLAAQSIGAEWTRYPDFLRMHAGYTADAFTFAAEANESRTVDFHFRTNSPEATYLVINPSPNLLP